MSETADERIGLGAARGLGATVIAIFVAITTEIVPVGLLPQLSRAFSVSEATTGLLVTAYAGLVAVLAVPLTRLTAGLPRRPLLFATIALYSVSNLVIALAPVFAVVVLGRVLGGVAHALFFSLIFAQAAALVAPRLQGRALAIAASGAPLGYVLGVPLVTSIGAALDWRWAFGALAIGGVLSGLAIAAALPEAKASVAHPAAQRGRRSALVAAAIVNAVVFFGHYTLYTYVSAVLLHAGVPEGAIGAALFLFGASGIVGLWLAGLVIDRRPRIGFLAALVLGAVCIVVLLPAGDAVAPTVSATAAWLVAFGAIPIFCTASCLRTRAASPDMAAAVNNAASNVGIALGAAIGGGLFTLAGLPAVIGVAAAAFAVAAVLVLALRPAFPARP